MPAVELNPAEDPVLTEVDLTPFNCAPFPGDEGFPTEEQKRVAGQIDQAYRRNGFMLLSNFGPTIEVLNTAFAESRELFKLPMEHKKEKFKKFDFANDGMIIGYRGFGTENLNKNRSPDYKESFQLNGYDMQDVKNLRGTPLSYQAAMKAFVSSMEDGIRRMGSAFAIGLGLEVDFFTKHMGDLSKNVVRSVHYPPSTFMPTVDDTSAIRVSEHCDISMMTFVFTDGPGLQMRIENDGVGSWASIPVPKGATAVVNTGAMLKRWTNDVWRITTHRCVLETEEQAAKDRYSVLYFNNPDHNAVVEAPPSLIPAGEKPKYEPTTAREHLAEMRAKIVGKDADK